MGAGASVDSSSAAARESVSQLGLSAPTLSALQQLPPGAQEELRDPAEDFKDVLCWNAAMSSNHATQ